MIKFTYGALALAAIGATSQAADTGWSGLDQEINSLSASLASQQAATTGPKVGGYIKASIDYLNDPLIEDDGGGGFTETDIFGENLRNVRVEVKGDAGSDYSYKVSFDLADGLAELKDAYVDWKITDGIKGRLGQYKVPFVRSYLVSAKNTLFLERTLVGGIISDLIGRQPGAMVSGQFEMVNFWVNAMNGVDGVVDDWYYNGRLTLDLMGDGVGMVEGAYGAGDAMGLQIGAAYGDDSALEDGQHWAVEATLTSGPFAISGEIASFDFETDVAAGGILNGVSGVPADAMPWDVTASFMFTDQYEIGIRYQDHDDDFDTSSYGAVVNRYVQGHDIKWTLQWMHLETDETVNGSDDLSNDAISLGLTIGF